MMIMTLTASKSTIIKQKQQKKKRFLLPSQQQIQARFLFHFIFKLLVLLLLAHTNTCMYITKDRQLAMVIRGVYLGTVEGICCFIFFFNFSLAYAKQKSFTIKAQAS